MVALTTVAPMVTSSVSVPAVPVTPEIRGSVADASAESDAITPQKETASNANMAKLMKHCVIFLFAIEVIV